MPAGRLFRPERARERERKRRPVPLFLDRHGSTNTHSTENSPSIKANSGQFSISLSLFLSSVSSSSLSFSRYLPNRNGRAANSAASSLSIKDSKLFWQTSLSRHLFVIQRLCKSRQGNKSKEKFPYWHGLSGVVDMTSIKIISLKSISLSFYSFKSLSFQFNLILGSVSTISI